MTKTERLRVQLATLDEFERELGEHCFDRVTAGDTFDRRMVGRALTLYRGLLRRRAKS